MAEQGPEQAQAFSPPAAAPERKLFSIDNIIVSLIMVVIGFGLGYGACYRKYNVQDLENTELELQHKEATLERATTAYQALQSKIRKTLRELNELNQQSDVVSRELGLATRRIGKTPVQRPAPSAAPAAKNGRPAVDPARAPASRGGKSGPAAGGS